MFLLYITNDILNLNEYFSYIIVYILTILLSFYLNQHKVFKTKFRMKDLFLYSATYITSMLFGLIVLYTLVYFLSDWNKTFLSIIVIPFTTIYNFIFVSSILK